MKTITAKEFDEKFDNGEDISEYLDFSKEVNKTVRVEHRAAVISTECSPFS